MPTGEGNLAVSHVKYLLVTVLIIDHSNINTPLSIGVFNVQPQNIIWYIMSVKPIINTVIVTLDNVND